MIDLLKPLIDRDALPRQRVAPGDVIIAGGESTSILFCLEHGEALFRAGQQATHFYLIQHGTINIAIRPG